MIWLVLFAYGLINSARSPGFHDPYRQEHQVLSQTVAQFYDHMVEVSYCLLIHIILYAKVIKLICKL